MSIFTRPSCSDSWIFCPPVTQEMLDEIMNFGLTDNVVKHRVMAIMKLSAGDCQANKQMLSIFCFHKDKAFKKSLIHPCNIAYNFTINPLF
jgi:hypothetical protein